MIAFHRFDLGENDFDFLEFDTVPKVVFYPKAVYGLGVDLNVFDDRMLPLEHKVIIN